MGWKPVTDLMREIHEGDPSMREVWPLEYWGLEPFRDNRPDWKIRYASVFQVGETLGEWRKTWAVGERLVARTQKNIAVVALAKKWRGSALMHGHGELRRRSERCQRRRQVGMPLAPALPLRAVA